MRFHLPALVVLLSGLVAPVAGAQPDDREVTYAGVTVTVPADWAVVDLDASDDVCVRLDRPTVYVGAPPEQENCPAHAVGRADTVWLGPTVPADGAVAGGRAPRRTWSKGLARGSVMRAEHAQEQTLVLEGRGVSVRTGWGRTGPARVDAVVEGLTVSPEGKPVPPRRPRGSSARPTDTHTTAPAVRGADVSQVDVRQAVTIDQAAVVTNTGKPLHGGMAFDTCAAPALSTMRSWRQSPYAAVGIYTSGSMRACPFRGGSSWVNDVVAQGWGLIPIHVGRQAPCVTQGNLALISRDLPTARSQATAEAREAVAALGTIGLGVGSSIFLDIESYATNDPGCSAAVVAFVSAWTQEVHRQGYVSGVYGAAGSMMRDMVNALRSGDAGFVPPDQIWVAHWNQLQTTRDTYSPQYFPDVYWAHHQRMRQYAGDHQETWGGVTLNIDSNWADLDLPGNPVRTDYGPNATGPGGPGFVFTGSMSYWRGAPGSGLREKAYWTRPTSSGVEANGATWELPVAAGTHRIDVNVPSTSNAATGRYTISAGGSPIVRTLDQAAGSGWRSLGTITVASAGKVSVHLGDNGTTNTSRTVWADAVRLVAVNAAPTVPSAPTGVAATAGDGRATVSWSPPATQGSPVTSYTVTAAPGGATVTVPAAETTATMTGLTNGTAYTFTVTATNSSGSGPSSAPSVPVMPGRAGGVTAIDPVRVVDTRAGTSANPQLSTAVPAGGTIRFRVAGSGAPIPTSASAVLANLTVVAGTGPGWLAVTGTESSLINWTAGDVVANLSTLPVASDGTVTLTNGAKTAAHVIVDVQGWTGSQESTRLTSLPATRLVDSRVGTASNPRATALGPNESLDVKVTGGAVPVGAVAALLRVTATEPGAPGHLTMSASGAVTTSVVNFRNGDSVGNALVAALTADGTVRLTNHSQMATHVVVDAQGWIGGAATQLYRTTPQVRLVDTRFGTLGNPGTTILGPGEIRAFRVAGGPGTPVPTGTSMVAVNLTVTDGNQPGWVAAGATSAPGIPLVNYRPGEARAGFGTIDVAPDGRVWVRNESKGRVHVVLDVHGYGTTNP